MQNSAAVKASGVTADDLIIGFDVVGLLSKHCKLGTVTDSDLWQMLVEMLIASRYRNGLLPRIESMMTRLCSGEQVPQRLSDCSVQQLVDGLKGRVDGYIRFKGWYELITSYKWHEFGYGVQPEIQPKSQFQGIGLSISALVDAGCSPPQATKNPW